MKQSDDRTASSAQWAGADAATVLPRLSISAFRSLESTLGLENKRTQTDDSSGERQLCSPDFTLPTACARLGAGLSSPAACGLHHKYGSQQRKQKKQQHSML